MHVFINGLFVKVSEPDFTREREREREGEREKVIESFLLLESYRYENVVVMNFSSKELLHSNEQIGSVRMIKIYSF